MRLCNDTITIVNVRHDVDADRDVYYPTTIIGVSWYCDIVTVVEKGLKAADKYVVRIPIDADFGGKAYVPPVDYAAAGSADGIFTIKNGDIIVRGIVSEVVKPADLHRNYEAFTVMGVTDNRRAPNAPHWKVIGT
jgi:hypothetical protein